MHQSFFMACCQGSDLRVSYGLMIVAAIDISVQIPLPPFGWRIPRQRHIACVIGGASLITLKHEPSH